MATLQEDIKQIFYNSIGVDNSNPGNIPEMAEQLSQAIIDWLKRQEFRIKRMKATLEIDKFKTTQPILGDVLPSVSVTTSRITGIPTPSGGGITPGTGTGTGNVVQGTKGVKVPVDLSKETGLIASGHAFIGPPAEGKPDADTTEEDNDYAVVQIVDGEEVA